MVTALVSREGTQCATILLDGQRTVVYGRKSSTRNEAAVVVQLAGLCRNLNVYHSISCLVGSKCSNDITIPLNGQLTVTCGFRNRGLISQVIIATCSGHRSKGGLVQNHLHTAGCIPVSRQLCNFTTGGRNGISVCARSVGYVNKNIGSTAFRSHRRRNTILSVFTVGDSESGSACIGISNGIGIHQAGGARLGDRRDTVARGTRSASRTSSAIGTGSSVGYRESRGRTVGISDSVGIHQLIGTGLGNRGDTVTRFTLGTSRTGWTGRSFGTSCTGSTGSTCGTIGHRESRGITIGISDSVSINQVIGTGLGDRSDTVTRGTGRTFGTFRTRCTCCARLALNTIGHRKSRGRTIGKGDGIGIHILISVCLGDRGDTVTCRTFRTRCTSSTGRTFRTSCASRAGNTIGHGESRSLTIGESDGISIHIVGGIRLGDRSNTITCRTGRTSFTRSTGRTFRTSCTGRASNTIGYRESAC